MLSNGFEVLLVSQFTLHGYFSGNKPDFHLSSTLFQSSFNCTESPSYEHF